MKKVIILLFLGLLAFCGCAKEDVNAEVDEEKVEEISPEPEYPEVEEEPETSPFGLTDKEIERIDNYLSSCPLNASFDDLVRVDRIPNENIPTMSGEVDYSKKHYALHFKDGIMIQICIPIEELEN